MRSAFRMIAAAFVAVFGFSVAALAAPVSTLAATQVAQNFMRSHVALHGSWNGATDPGIASMDVVSLEGEPLVYNVRVQPSGFLLVAYDDDFSPVLLYSDTDAFDPEQLGDPNSIAAWIIPETHAVMHDMRKRAAEIGSKELIAAIKAQSPSSRAWAHFNRSARDFDPLPLALKADGPADGEKLLKAGPLLTSAWAQGGPNAPYTYNLYTPAVSGTAGCAHVLTGCVATAAAQLLRYHGWPDSGVGSNSYSWQGTTLSASFAHAYNWSSMPNKLTGSSSQAQIDAVARLMSDLGIANKMTYGCGNSSSVTQNMAQNVLPTYFKYRNIVQVVDRRYYTAGDFFNALRAEIDASRPMLFRMNTAAGDGHAVVVDGYQLGATNMVHVNLGWTEGYNLYYDISSNWTASQFTWVATSQIAFTNIQPDRATSCTYALSGSTLSAGAGAGSGSVNVSTASACAWNATSNASFVTVTSGASGTGNGAVGFSIAANSGAARSGTLTIGGQTFTVNQSAAACSYSLSASSQSIGASAGSGNIGVTTGGGCAWTAYSNADWITITSGASGSGSGSVVYSAAGNGSLSARSGTVIAAGQTFTVNQAAASCTYTVAPSSATYNSGATTGRLNVTALAGCSWTAQSGASWLTITAGGSGNGEGTVSYSVAANTGSPRTGSITVGGQSLTVTQSGPSSTGAELLNGDFENGRTDWTQEGPYYLIYQDFLYAYEGTWYAWLAGYDNATDRLYQKVTIPANASQASLQFVYGIDTEEAPTGAYDKMFVEVYNGTTGNLVATLGQFSNLDAGPYWVNKSYDLSAYKGQSIYIAFHATSDSSLNTNFYVDNVKLSVGGGGGGAANYTALWWNANESGWGLNLNHQSDLIFATLFDYDANGRAMWLVATLTKQAPQNGVELFAGDLLRTTGPAFNASPFTPIDGTNVTTVGAMAVGFSGDTAAVSYTVNGVPVTKTMSKQAVGPRVATCTAGGTDRTALTNYQDLWWAGQSESGWGINLTHSGDNIFATLFTYDNAGQGTHNPGLWLVTTAVRQSDGSYLGDLLRTTGPPFNANPFTPITAANVTTVGTMRFRFTSGSQGTLTYTVNGATVTKTITRQVFGTTVPSCTS